MADDDEDDWLLVESAFQEMSIDHELHFVADGRNSWTIFTTRAILRTRKITPCPT